MLPPLHQEDKRMLFQEIDNMVWSGDEEDISRWCKRNKVYDEITDEEIAEIWNREAPGQEEPIRLNGKYVWETAKRVCDFINAHEELIHITTFGEYRSAMKKVMKVIKEAYNTERKRRQTSTRKKKCEEAKKTMQRAKALIVDIKRGGMERQEVERRLESIYGKGSREEFTKATTDKKSVERIVELSRRKEEQFEEWEKMRREAKRRQWEDRRLNIFLLKNKSVPQQF